MSTVHINLRDVFGVAVACHVIFRPADTPSVSGTLLTISGSRSIQLDENGTGNVALQAGRYSVRFLGISGNSDAISITVPNDNELYNLTALIGSGTVVVTPAPDYVRRSANLSDIPDRAAAFEAIKQRATTTTSGTVRFATQQQVNAGMDAESCLSPESFAGAAKWDEMEPALGVPDEDGNLLSSNATGARSWVKRSRVLVVATDAGRLALTGADVQPLDWVKVLELIGGKRTIWGVMDTGLLNKAGGWLPLGTFRLIPENTSTPCISGNASVGQVLRATPGTWTDEPTAYYYQWQRTTLPTSQWVDINEATAQTYSPSLEDLDMGLRVCVRVANEIGISQSVASSQTGAVSIQTLTNGVVAYWRLDESSGARVDSTGNGYDFTEENAVGSGLGLVGSAADFDGTNGMVCADIGIGTMEEFTLAGWVKFKEFVDYQYQQDTIFAKVLTFHVSLRAASGGIGAYIWGVGDLDTGIVPVIGEWYFVLLQLSGGLVELSVNNAEFESRAAMGPLYGDAPLRLGRVDSFTNPASVLMDNVGVWNRALTNEERATLYNSGNGYQLL